MSTGILLCLSREEEEEDEGGPLQAALQEELHDAAGGGGGHSSFLFPVSSPPSDDSSLCSLIGRTCPRGQSPITCRQWPLPPRCHPATSAAFVGFPLIIPAPPAGGATAAASVFVHTERLGTHTHTHTVAISQFRGCILRGLCL